MTSEPIIELTDVHFAYRMSKNRARTIKEFAIQLARREIQHEQMWALRGVSLAVNRGEVFSVIGRNGAGKSTLMKLIARVLPPTTGRIVVRGMVAPMIELGAGFNQELTGYENIVLYGTILGRPPALMRERAAEIAKWAQIEEFLDAPVRTYSSGMLARLGFAVATDIQPEVLVVDEVLSVGDEAFRQRSSQRIMEMIERGTSVVFVSHALETVLDISDRVLWLERGTPRAQGAPQQVVDDYQASVTV